MPQFIGLVLIWGACIAGYKTVRHIAGRMTAEAERAAREAQRNHAGTAGEAGIKDLGALELDPNSGVYKPRES